MSKDYAKSGKTVGGCWRMLEEVLTGWMMTVEALSVKYSFIQVKSVHATALKEMLFSSYNISSFKFMPMLPKNSTMACSMNEILAIHWYCLLRIEFFLR